MNKTLKNTNETVETKEEFKCDHCRRTFVKPASFAKHLCEQKRRWQDRDRPANRIAFQAWLKFYGQMQPSRKKREYRDFSESAYYLGFIRYGLYCVEAGVVNSMAYVDYLLKNNIALDSWNSDRVYTKYLIFYLRDEDPLDAVKRSVEYMLNISESEHVELRDIFRYVNSNKICHHIATGKISPWIVYRSKSGRDFLANLNEDQQSIIFEYIDPDRWNIKFKRETDSVKQVEEIIKAIGGL